MAITAHDVSALPKPWRRNGVVSDADVLSPESLESYRFRLYSGYYDSRAVMRAVADRLLETDALV
jgi:hypothetical protein